MSYEVITETVVWGHHIYKAGWIPAINKKLFGKKYGRAEEYNKFSVGIFKPIQDILLFVGYAPTELLFLLFHFLENNKGSVFLAYTSIKKHREVGMDVFRHYRVMTQKLKENNTTRPRILRKNF